MSKLQRFAARQLAEQPNTRLCGLLYLQSKSEKLDRFYYTILNGDWLFLYELKSNFSQNAVMLNLTTYSGLQFPVTPSPKHPTANAAILKAENSSSELLLCTFSRKEMLQWIEALRPVVEKSYDGVTPNLLLDEEVPDSGEYLKPKQCAPPDEPLYYPIDESATAHRFSDPQLGNSQQSRPLSHVPWTGESSSSFDSDDEPTLQQASSRSLKRNSSTPCSAPPLPPWSGASQRIDWATIRSLKQEKRSSMRGSDTGFEGLNDELESIGTEDSSVYPISFPPSEPPGSSSVSRQPSNQSSTVRLPAETAPPPPPPPRSSDSVPSVYTEEKNFICALKASEANKLLSTINLHGCFLVRGSSKFSAASDTASLTLCVWKVQDRKIGYGLKRKIRWETVDGKPGFYFECQKDNRRFSSVSECVRAHYRELSLGLPYALVKQSN